MSKLLNKPFKAFTIYALVVLVCSVPVYYMVVDSIWLEELDEHNLIIKERIENRFNTIEINEAELENILKIWNLLQPGTQIIASNLPEVKADSIYTTRRTNAYSSVNEIDRFRGLSSCIYINKKPYHLTIETNVEEADETFLAITLVTFLFFSLLVAGFIVLNRRIAKKIWQPFRNTLNKVKSFNLLTDKNIEFEKSGIEEFEELNTELSKLIERNILIFNQQKAFIENASHELQTPLAILKSKVEMLLQNKDLTEKQSELINSINTPLSRVTRINKNLLLLAKIENNQFAEGEHIDLTTILNENLELLADYIEAKGITIEKKISNPIRVFSNKTLLEILLNNLLINAITHNSVNGKIHIDCVEKRLTVSNTGNSELSSNTLFKRFSISSSETTNSGLGLSIAKEICARYNWQINYTFQNNLHSFSIWF
jgi:signal transduction histidine kinase